jgi:acyl carrier protein phosphodiesterase
MNHLAHFALAGPSTECLVGAFLGDYVKGRLKGVYSEDIETGIALHRAIDAFTDHHPIVRRSQARFDAQYRRYAGIMTDIIYDHVLAQAWSIYYPEPLIEFSQRSLQTLVDHGHLFEPGGIQTATRMLEHNALAGYTSDVFVARSFSYLATKLTRANPLATAFGQFEAHLPELRQDFAVFYPLLMEFCQRSLETGRRPQA